MILDIILIAFIAFSAFRGFKKGLTTILVSLVGFILAIILAFLFKGNVANLIVEKTQIDKSMEQIVTDSMKNSIDSKIIDTNVQNNYVYNLIIKNVGINDNIDLTTKNIVRFLIETASFMIIFMAVVSCSFILQAMLNIVFDLPVLSSINDMGGLIAGGAMAIVKLWIILALITLVVPLYPNINNFIESSVIAKILNSTNLIVGIISSGIKF